VAKESEIRIGLADEAREKLLSVRTADTTVLAYVGDAAYELYVRTRAAESGLRKAAEISRWSVGYVKADSQACAAKALLGTEPPDGAVLLTEEERTLMKRARNRTATGTPRGSTEAAYKLATGLEALAGWLYLQGDTERFAEIMDFAMETIRKENQNE